jgi:hypothetical protein
VSADAKFGSNLSLRPVSLFPDAFPARRAGQWSRVPTRSAVRTMALAAGSFKGSRSRRAKSRSSQTSPRVEQGPDSLPMSRPPLHRHDSMGSRPRMVAWRRKQRLSSDRPSFGDYGDL